MTLESAKEMDRRCVLNWLIDIIRSPTVAFNTYSDEHQIEFAHDAIVLLKEQATPWISVEDRPPESGKHVFATCEIRSLSGHKKRYVCEAYYAKDHSISVGSYPEDDDCYDYSEEDDEYYLKEGWYEVIHNWDEFGSVPIGDFVTHWMPLPEPHKEEEDASGTD